MSIGLGIAIAGIWIGTGIMAFAVKNLKIESFVLDCPVILPIVGISSIITVFLTGT